MTAFKAFRIDREEKQIIAGFQSLQLDDLTEGEVVIQVNWSGINYKDALAGTGKHRQSPASTKGRVGLEMRYTSSSTMS